jgi:hypothetical protein
MTENEFPHLRNGEIKNGKNLLLLSAESQRWFGVSANHPSKALPDGGKSCRRRWAIESRHGHQEWSKISSARNDHPGIEDIKFRRVSGLLHFVDGTLNDLWKRHSGIVSAPSFLIVFLSLALWENLFQKGEGVIRTQFSQATSLLLDSLREKIFTL